MTQGADLSTAGRRTYGALFGVVQRQAAMLSFIEAFWSVTYEDDHERSGVARMDGLFINLVLVDGSVGKKLFKHRNNKTLRHLTDSVEIHVAYQFAVRQSVGAHIDHDSPGTNHLRLKEPSLIEVRLDNGPRD